MEQRYGWSWVEDRVAHSAEVWDRCAAEGLPPLPRFTPREQRQREKAYDKGLRTVEREAKRIPTTKAERVLAYRRIIDTFPPFAAVALGLGPEAVKLLTGTFLPVGTDLARWARSFDPEITVPDTIQACRNAWTACGLQALLGRPMRLTPSLLAYSLLYPYSDNYLDDPTLSAADKLLFSERFRERLGGRRLAARNCHEASVWAMVRFIEEEYSRQGYPQVFDCLLAIHRAQEESMVQLRNAARFRGGDRELLEISCAKGGTSVLSDACLAQPWLSSDESHFSFEWGVLLQLGDDLQDVQEDLTRGSATLFTRCASAGLPLDGLVLQLLNFSQRTADRMDRLPHGSVMLKNLLRMSWRSLILIAVAGAQQFFTRAFIAELESCSTFHFHFLRERNGNIAARELLYSRLFDAFVEASPPDSISLPAPDAAMADSARPQRAAPYLESAFAGHAPESAWGLRAR